MEEDQNIETPAVSEVTQPITPTNPVKPVSKLSIKAIIGIIIFLLLAGGAAAGYVYREPIMKLVAKPTPTTSPILTVTPTPTPDPTADWKIYQGDGLSFKIPVDHQVIPKENGDILFIATQGATFDQRSPYITLDLRRQAIYADYHRAVDSLISQFKNIKDYRIENGKDKIVIFHGPYSVADFSNDLLYGKFIYWNYQSGAVTAHYEFSNKNQSQIFDQILSTFKFTDTQTDTSNWKTYENTEYNFLFKYPSSFTLVKEDKQVFKSTTLDKESVTIHQFNLQFTNGKMVQYDKEYPPAKDRSYLGINVESTNGKTISDLYNNKEANFGMTKVTHLTTTGNADEVAEVSNIENALRFYRKGDILVSFSSSQDGPGEIDKYREQIFSTFTFDKLSASKFTK